MKSLSASLFIAMSSLTDVDAENEFIEWTRRELQPVFPHGAFICGAGDIHSSGIKPDLMLSHQFPEKYLSFIHAGDGTYRTNTLLNWMQSGKPQLVEFTEQEDQSEESWKAVFKASGLGNIASHGVLDTTHHFASYFSFHQIPSPLTTSHNRLLTLIVPGMHATVLRIIQKVVLAHTDKSPTVAKIAIANTLSPREKEVLYWVSKGKTNYEISIILGISYKTVKNQVQAILIKLRVNNRAQAVAKSIEGKLFG